jgi:hypothetical protein
MDLFDTLTWAEILVKTTFLGTLTLTVLNIQNAWLITYLGWSRPAGAAHCSSPTSMQQVHNLGIVHRTDTTPENTGPPSHQLHIPHLPQSDLINPESEPPSVPWTANYMPLMAACSHPEPATSPISDRECRSGEQFWQIFYLGSILSQKQPPWGHVRRNRDAPITGHGGPCLPIPTCPQSCFQPVSSTSTSCGNFWFQVLQGPTKAKSTMHFMGCYRFMVLLP